VVGKDVKAEPKATESGFFTAPAKVVDTTVPKAGAGVNPPADTGPFSAPPAEGATEIAKDARVPDFNELMSHNKEMWRQQQQADLEERQAIAELVNQHRSKKHKPQPMK